MLTQCAQSKHSQALTLGGGRGEKCSLHAHGGYLHSRLPDGKWEANMSINQQV